MNIFKFQQFDIIQDHAAMKVGTDSDILGAMAAGGQRILDIGTGTGVLSLMMAQRFPEAKITAVEIDDNAILDAQANFAASPFAQRLTLHHMAFQDYLKEAEKAQYDCVICNPPYFDKSLEPDNEGRMRARHTSSLPFSTLCQGAYDLLQQGGVFTVCIPPEVLSNFNAECIFAGFALRDIYQVKSVPEKGVKRYILVHVKGKVEQPVTHTFCMRDEDRSVSQWYKDLMKDFLLKT